MQLKILIQFIFFSLCPLLTKVINNALYVFSILHLYNPILADGIHAHYIINLIEFHILFYNFLQSIEVFIVFLLDLLFSLLVFFNFELCFIFFCPLSLLLLLLLPQIHILQPIIQLTLKVLRDKTFIISKFDCQIRSQLRDSKVMDILLPHHIFNVN